MPISKGPAILVSTVFSTKKKKKTNQPHDPHIHCGNFPLKYVPLGEL